MGYIFLNMHNQERIDYYQIPKSVADFIKQTSCNELLMIIRGWGTKKGVKGDVYVLWGRIEIIMVSFFIHIL